MKTLNDIELTPRDRDALDDAISILKRQFPTDRVILFGSKSRGTSTTESDMDLLVLTTRKLTWREKDAITDALYDVELKHEVVISTLIATVDEWDNGNISILPIHAEVAHDGIEV